MSIWTDRYLILLGTVGIALSAAIGYQYAMNLSHSVPAPRIRSSMSDSFVKHALQDVQLPSMIPYFRIGAKRHLFFPVDLHRVDLLADLQSDSPIARPLLDKVLFVPKEFLPGRDA